jgi:uncharacterized SAM-binding protein YcdF (DUF218 family)
MEFPVKLLLTPVMIIWALLLITLLQQWRAQRRLPRATLFTFLLFWLFSSKPMIDQLAKPLELAYPAFATPAPTSATLSTSGRSAPAALSHILVLGCNHQDSHFLPLTSKAEPCSLARLSEAIRLWHLYPDAQLHVSGHIVKRSQSHTDFARQYAIAMGVAPAKIISHSEATNTRGEVEALIAAIDQQPAALVTSAMHMPRSCNWFAHYGGQVIAAPTDYHVRRLTNDIGWQSWFPTAQSLMTLSYAFYEYMGLVQQYFQIQSDASDSSHSANTGCQQPIYTQNH